MDTHFAWKAAGSDPGAVIPGGGRLIIEDRDYRYLTVLFFEQAQYGR